MRRYINNFKTESEYNQSAFSLDYPNINYIQNTDKVIWSRTRPRYKFLYEDTSGNSGGTAWDSANTQISQSDFINLGVDTSNIINLTVDSDVTAIGNYAFGSYNSGMTYNTMPNVTSIGTSAFVSDGGYIDITKFPNLTTLGDNAIRLNDFDSLPSGITTIGRNSLNISSSNYNLKYAESGITIPSGITTTNGRLGADDTFISRVIFESSIPPTDNSSNKYYGAQEMYVPNGYKSAYEAAGFNTHRLCEMSGMQSGYSVTIEDESGNEIVKVPRMNYREFEWDTNPESFLGTEYLRNLFGTTHFHRINIYHAYMVFPENYNFYNTSYDELYIGDDVGWISFNNSDYPYYTFRAKKIIIDVPNANNRNLSIYPKNSTNQGYIEEIEFKDGDWTTNKYYVSQIQDIPSLRRIYFPYNFEFRNQTGDAGNAMQVYNLPSLEELTLPSATTVIRLSNLTSITSITLEANTVVENIWNFENTNNCPIYVPASIVNDYVEHYSGSVDTSRFIGYIDRNGSGTTCENGDLYATSTVERSYDGGQTWVVIRATKGSLIESASTECPSCVLNFCGTDSLGNPISIDNGSTYLSRDDMMAASNAVEGAVGIKTETIGSYCFEYLHNITSLTMDYTVTTIENEAFMENSMLSTLTIPASVTSIGFWAFTRLYGLNEVIFQGTTPPTLDSTNLGVFHDFCPPVIYVPDSAVSAYRAISGKLWTNQVWDSNIIQPISNRN